MSSEDCSAPLVDLDLPSAFPSGALEAEVESADA